MEKIKRSSKDSVIEDVKSKKKPKIYIKNLFKLGKGNDIIKNEVLENVKSSTFEDEEDYQLTTSRGAFDHTYLQSESNVDRSITLILHGYINKIRPYLKHKIKFVLSWYQWHLENSNVSETYGCLFKSCRWKKRYVVKKWKYYSYAR